MTVLVAVVAAVSLPNPNPRLALPCPVLLIGVFCAVSWFILFCMYLPSLGCTVPIRAGWGCDWCTDRLSVTLHLVGASLPPRSAHSYPPTPHFRLPSTALAASSSSCRWLCASPTYTQGTHTCLWTRKHDLPLLSSHHHYHAHPPTNTHTHTRSADEIRRYSRPPYTAQALWKRVLDERERWEGHSVVPCQPPLPILPPSVG